METKKRQTLFPYDEVNPSVIQSLCNIGEIHHYDTSGQLFYEGQTPIVAFILLKGHIQLIKNRRVKKVLQGGEILGLWELMNNAPSHYTANILDNSDVCFLDKSTIFEIIRESGDPPLIDEFVRPVLQKIIFSGHQDHRVT